MPRTKLVSTITSVVMALIATTASLAHETDVHHWFEHQRALSDGGDILPPHSTVVSQRTEAHSLAGARDAEMRRAPPDCLIEEMKRTENYVPSSACAYRRPLIEEAREDKRNRMR